MKWALPPAAGGKVANPYGSDSTRDADALRLKAEQLREASRALARQALEARTEAQRLGKRAKTASQASERLTLVHADLRKNVEALAVHLRKMDVPPERVVTSVKAIGSEAAQMSLIPLPHIERTALTRDLVRWAVDAYYAI